ncbi:MAG: hypothetical protein ACKVG4_08400 [Longimicrobiales bacterium]|jgi:hypothetical protein
MYQLIAHEGADAFLGRAEAWLHTREAEHNLHLSLSYARRDSGTTEPDTLFGTVEAESEVLGCVIRTPPHTWGVGSGTSTRRRLVLLCSLH